ncbi:MAG: tRNA 4-thiouridine(8) synthase ThiI [bacterium]|nr:tRNA 4-thiouridine(8) synthase ThiI [bacterium]
MRAVALISGGLDSALAAKLIIDQGIEVIGVNMLSPFFDNSHMAKDCCRELKIPLQIIDISSEYLDIIKNPRYGFGKNLNPCIDCHAFMLKKAGRYMDEIKASFLITGEVLGERPKSQSRFALHVVGKESGYGSLVLRPLSALLLEETYPEEKGLVSRRMLLSLHGRSRRPQLELARRFGLTRFLTPASGCLLTDRCFSRRLRDLMNHSELTLSDVELLKIGRHFRISETCKIVIGRNKQENESLLRLVKSGDLCISVEGYKGPIGITRGEITPDIILRSSSLCVRYSDAPTDAKVKVKYILSKKTGQVLVKGEDATHLGITMI